MALIDHAGRIGHWRRDQGPSTSAKVSSDCGIDLDGRNYVAVRIRAIRQPSRDRQRWLGCASDARQEISPTNTTKRPKTITQLRDRIRCFRPLHAAAALAVEPAGLNSGSYS